MDPTAGASAVRWGWPAIVAACTGVGAVSVRAAVSGTVATSGSSLTVGAAASTGGGASTTGGATAGTGAGGGGSATAGTATTGASSGGGADATGVEAWSAACDGALPTSKYPAAAAPKAITTTLDATAMETRRAGSRAAIRRNGLLWSSAVTVRAAPYASSRGGSM